MKARHNRYRNDLYWSVYDMEDGEITWTGYNDANWWNNVAPKCRVQKGKSGKSYEIDFGSGLVTVTAAAMISQQSVDRLSEVAQEVRRQRDLLRPVVELVSKLPDEPMSAAAVANLRFLAIKAMESIARSHP